MASANALLKSVFGFDAFRPGQEEIVRAVANGESVLAIMPTGGGKSLCYQLPALMGEGLTLVISPLIALMRDQVSALKQAGVAAGALTSAASEDENQAVIDAARTGELSLLYLAPERLSSTVTRNILRDAGVEWIDLITAGRHCITRSHPDVKVRN